MPALLLASQRQALLILRNIACDDIDFATKKSGYKYPLQIHVFNDTAAKAAALKL